GASTAWIQELMKQQKEEGAAQDKKEKQKGQKKEKEKDIKLADYVREVNTADRNNDIIVEYASGGPRPNMTEEEAEASLAAMLSGGRNKQAVPVDYIVDGEQTVTVRLP
ncbi:MAG: hypothetical protein IJ181_09655, partial [Acidaminococcaceae bacterium]|nr:hypothetical protein [Acidaminococcaceae bacterium]